MPIIHPRGGEKKWSFLELGSPETKCRIRSICKPPSQGCLDFSQMVPCQSMSARLVPCSIPPPPPPPPPPPFSFHTPSSATGTLPRSQRSVASVPRSSTLQRGTRKRFPWTSRRSSGG